MEETNIIICLKKRNKTERIYKKKTNLEAKKLKLKFFDFFSFHSIKMEQETVYFKENSIIKSAIIKTKKLLTSSK